MKALPLIIVGAGAVYLTVKGFNTAQAVTRLTYGNPRVKLGKLSLLNFELELTLDIKNPGSTDINLDYFTGDVLYTGKKLSSFTFDAKGKNLTLKSRQITKVPFTVVISNVNAISIVTKLITALGTGGAVSTVIGIDGSIYAAGIDVPVKFSYDLKSNTVAGIGSVKATLEFSDNGAMEKYFTGKRASRKMMFSKN